MIIDEIFTLNGAANILAYTSAITGTVFFYKYKHTFLKYFLVLLWYVALNEILGHFLYKYSILRNNSIIYNIYHIINFSFLFILFRTYVKENTHKKWIKLFLITYILSFSIAAFFVDYSISIQVIPFIIGAVFIIISILFYFLEILNTNKVLYVSNNLLFWISVGLFLYFVGKIPMRIILNYSYEEEYFNAIIVARSVLSIVMNLCFIIGFIWSQKDKQY